MYFSELGAGWAPALLETRDELLFVEQSQYFLTDVQEYFIGGSAEPEVLGSFDYLPQPYFNPPAYTARQSGSVFYIFCIGLVELVELGEFN